MKKLHPVELNILVQYQHYSELAEIKGAKPKLYGTIFSIQLETRKGLTPVIENETMKVLCCSKIGKKINHNYTKFILARILRFPWPLVLVCTVVDGVGSLFLARSYSFQDH